MRNFQDAFETLKQSFISTFSICMTVPLMPKSGSNLLSPGQSGGTKQVEHLGESSNEIWITNSENGSLNQSGKSKRK